MRKSDFSYLVGSVFIAATAALYAYARWAHVNVPRYYPVEHTWKMVKEPGAISQAWYGVQGFAFAGGAVAAFAVFLVLKCIAHKTDKLSDAMVRSVGIVVTAITVVSMGYIAWDEFTKWGVL